MTTLTETHPPQYEFLRSHYESIQQALEDCSYNYPTTKQVMEVVNEPAITAQMVGNILSVLADFDVIGVQSRRNNSNRYDLTQYNPTRMDDLAELLAANSDS